MAAGVISGSDRRGLDGRSPSPSVRRLVLKEIDTIRRLRTSRYQHYENSLPALRVRRTELFVEERKSMRFQALRLWVTC